MIKCNCLSNVFWKLDFLSTIYYVFLQRNKFKSQLVFQMIICHKPLWFLYSEQPSFGADFQKLCCWIISTSETPRCPLLCLLQYSDHYKQSFTRSRKSLQLSFLSLSSSNLFLHASTQVPQDKEWLLSPLPHPTPPRSSVSVFGDKIFAIKWFWCIFQCHLNLVTICCCSNFIAYYIMVHFRRGFFRSGPFLK